jgi:hypothetical protein
MRQAISLCKENSLDYLAQKMQMAQVFAISNRLWTSRFERERVVAVQLCVGPIFVGGEGFNEMRDLLTTPAAEQKQLRIDLLGQQGERMQVNRGIKLAVASSATASPRAKGVTRIGKDQGGGAGNTEDRSGVGGSSDGQHEHVRLSYHRRREAVTLVLEEETSSSGLLLKHDESEGPPPPPPS